MSFVLSPQLQHLFDTQPGCWGCKDEQSNFLYANQTCATLVGVPRKESMVGLSDLDLPCEVAESAHLFRAQDREVMRRNVQLRMLDIHCFADKQWRAFIFSKTPLRDAAQNIIGTIFHGQVMDSHELLELGILLNKITCNLHDSHWLTTPTSYTIGHHGGGPRLSPRQEEVLFLFLRGRSARQTALALGIATRTVEWHLCMLKEKFSAQSKSELFDRAIEQGHLHNLPPGLCKRPLSIILRETA
ncbi:MAG: helix-turn-helix transcriptional regulator [Paludibacterium sp.]|uniref:helix-turn-helix transcriptional regulator n=1 Tax=Paludibacterium sp. TaxID=1917523 RepID=UPI0025FFCA11|nr:helix-turn-helix transcriptional regulator [Paludibacterium sp.]MBV8046187.1 helix-turn-helix transcriptional regulator [Paludibacterium sp.]MBV8649318.1 helix-turn-helix transcriptional regulator [Paludibacterium sp.]